MTKEGNHGTFWRIRKSYSRSLPVNNRGTAKTLVAFAEADATPLLKKYKIHNVLGQYHSAFEHTFLWILDAEEPHLVEEFALETGLASFNNLRIVPLLTLAEGVLPRVKRVHGL